MINQIQETIRVPPRNIMFLILTVLIFAGCGKVTSSSDWNINGHRTITRKHDGITRRLESATDIEIQGGHITKFANAALVKIEELGGAEQRQAKLRENAGRLELWVKENGIFRKGSPRDETWLEDFLTDVIMK